MIKDLNNWKRERQIKKETIQIPVSPPDHKKINPPQIDPDLNEEDEPMEIRLAKE